MQDIDRAVKFYESIGIGPFTDYPPLQEYIKLEIPDEEGFFNLIIKCAQIGPIEMQLIQPTKGGSHYKDFLKNRGEGIYHLGFVVDDIEQSESIVKGMGLNIISKGRRANGSGFAYLGTADKGGITLLIRQSSPKK